jgi:hypothetical protein
MARSVGFPFCLADPNQQGSFRETGENFQGANERTKERTIQAMQTCQFYVGKTIGPTSNLIVMVFGGIQNTNITIVECLSGYLEAVIYLIRNRQPS